MSAIVSRIYTTTLAGVITPQEGTGTIFRLLSDGLLYCMLPNRTYFPIGESSGVSTSNIIIQVGEGDIPLTGTETELYAIQLAQDIVFNEVNFPNLTDLDYIGITQAEIVETISFPLLENAISIGIIDNIRLVSVDLSSLSTVSELIQIEDNRLLQDLTLPNSLVCTSFIGTDNALSQQSVDDILVALDNGGSINGTADLTGGTNSAPGAAGTIAAASLAVKGWTLTTN